MNITQNTCYRIIIIIICGFLMGPLIGCSREDDFANRFCNEARSAMSANRDTISYSGITDFDWDQVFIFAPYTPTAEIEKNLGYKWPGAAKSGIESSDTFYLVVFTKQGQVVRDYRFSTAYGDFGDLESKNCFTRGADNFVVRRAEKGRFLFAYAAKAEKRISQ